MINTYIMYLLYKQKKNLDNMIQKIATLLTFLSLGFYHIIYNYVLFMRID